MIPQTKTQKNALIQDPEGISLLNYTLYDSEGYKMSLKSVYSRTIISLLDENEKACLSFINIAWYYLIYNRMPFFISLNPLLILK